jgi:hypothetical protein
MSGAHQEAAVHFIVKYQGKYYLTQELWEFDPAMDKSSLHPDQAFWLTQIPELYDDSTDRADGAVHVTAAQVCKASQIGGGGLSAP